MDHRRRGTIVAHSWVDPAFHGRMLTDGKAEAEEIGFLITLASSTAHDA